MGNVTVMRPLAAREVKMNKSIYRVLGLAVLFVALFSLGGTQEALAQVQVNIGIVAPPPLQFAAPPDLYVIPSGTSYVYMVPNYDGVYFYGGHWYRFYDGYWFRSSRYNGHWDYIEQPMVPQVIYILPPEYIHYVPSGYYRIHYNDFYGNWQTWDQRRHWDNYDWYQRERSDDIRRERYSRIERDRQQRGVQTQQQRNVQQPQQRNVQQPQQRNVQQPQQRDVQQPQQRDVQKPQQRDVQQPQQRDVQKQQHQQGQSPQQHDVQKQQKQQGQSPQQHDVQKQQGQSPQQGDDQKQQHQQKEKEHGANK